MICVRKILALFIIFMMLVPFVCAGDTKHVGDEKVVSEKPTTEKVTDKTKEKTTEITSKDKSITGKITVTDTDISKYKVEKKSSTEISISKEEAKGEHTKAKVSISKSELQKIDIDKDGKFGLLHISDTGEVTHTTATEAELVAGKVMTFSTNIVNGYSGYKQYTFSDVESGDTLNIEDISGNNTITAAVDGAVPTYTAGIPTNGLVAYWLFNNNLLDATGTRTATYYSTAKYGTNKTGATNSAVSLTQTWESLKLPSMTMNSIVINAKRTSGTYIIDARTGLSNGYITTTGVGSGISQLYSNSLNTSRTPTKITTGVWNCLYIQGTSIFTDDINIYSSYTGGESGSVLIDDIWCYNTSLNQSQIKQHYAGGSGISFQPEPSYNFTGYNVASGVEKVLNTDDTCTGIEYVDTTGGTHDVTVTVYFTEDTTCISDTHNEQYQNVSIVHTSGKNATSGTIAYELLTEYTGTPVLTASNNTNASVGRNSTHLLIYTGLLKTGQSKYYNVSIPKGDGGFVNPSATVVVIITAAGAFIGGSFINKWYRRRRGS